ncbi:MAG: hypothetical protein QXK06_04240 [Candidatus Diapherotrites archaeon]
MPVRGRRRVFAEKKDHKGTWVFEEPEKVFLGRGVEGNVYGVRFSVKSRNGKRERSRGFAVKEFFAREVGDYYTNMRHPKPQFEIIRELIELNKKKRLGLRLPATVRLLRGKNENPRLLLSWHKDGQSQGLRKTAELSEKEKAQFLEDMERQALILEREGYTANFWRDKFEPFFDSKEKKCVALLLDFGGLEKKKKK